MQPVTQVRTRPIREKRKGHIMLPVHGMFWLALLGFPLICFLDAYSNYLKTLAPPAAPPQITLLGLVVSFAVACVVSFFGMILLIALPIFIGCFEAGTERIGLGATQYWYGKTFFERLNREVVRAIIFFGAGVVACYGAHQYFSSMPLDVEVYAALSLWGPLVVAFYLVFAALKTVFPSFGGFQGDPRARYCHVF